MIHLLNLGASGRSIKIHSKIDCDHLRLIILMNISHTNTQIQSCDAYEVEKSKTETNSIEQWSLLCSAATGEKSPFVFILKLSLSSWFDQYLLCFHMPIGVIKSRWYFILICSFFSDYYNAKHKLIFRRILRCFRRSAC